MDSKAVSTQQIISTANTKFNDIKSLNNQFLGFVSNTLLTIKNPITLSILGQSLIVDFFDIKAKAYPRFVLAGINPPVFFVEYIFGWKGLGKVTVDALEKLDFPVVMGSVLVSSFFFILINLLADLLYGLVDPMVRMG